MVDYNINAVVVNLSSGSVSTGDINIESNAQSIGNVDEIKKQLSDLIKQIRLASENNSITGFQEHCQSIKLELEKRQPNFNIIKSTLENLKGIVTGVSANIITPYILQALALL